MKTLIIYISIHNGNTEKIAKEMAKIFNAELLRPNKIEVNTLSKYDLIGFGSGIYFFKQHKALLALVDNLPIMKNKKAFIFSTRGIGPVWFYHRPLFKKLLEKGFDIVGKFSCRGFDTYLFDRYIPFLKFTGGLNKGRPNKKDLEDARNFAINLKKDMIERLGL
ncbi:flavodoxin family protein [Candidatus Parcubacteria bacterium]|nr:flavodoxin family protein [Candidatus Parcubacteria bacterium]